MKSIRTGICGVVGGLSLFVGTVWAADESTHDMSSMMAAPSAALASAGSMPSGVLWLSESAPGMKMSASDHNHTPALTSGQGQSTNNHEQHGSADAAVAEGGEAAQPHVEGKQLWLRMGADPMRAGVASATTSDATLRVVGANGQIWNIQPKPEAGRFHAEVPLQEMGFYNAYLTQMGVSDGRLNVSVAKAELLKGTCCEKSVDPAQEKPISDPEQPIELVRDHLPNEKLFTRIVSGDKLGFTVQSNGKPLPGASVTLSTQLGWKKTLVSDAAGRAEFTMIRDYFPEWTNFHRMARQTFLVVADADVPSNGIYDGKPFAVIHYQTSLSGKYAPSPYDYRSYAFGLGISLSTIVFIGTAIYLYRRRRVKPFKEVRFNEGA